MLKKVAICFLLPNLALASICGTLTIAPDVRLAQTGIPTTYQSLHQFRITNTSSYAESYQICRSLLINTQEPQAQKRDDACENLTVAAYATSPVVELKSTVHTAIQGGDRMIMHAAVSSIRGSCIASDMKDSKTYIYMHPSKK